MRKSNLYLVSVSVASVLLVVSFVDAQVRIERAESHLARVKQMVNQLELTDLSLFTEARYTRHLSQADYHTAFQDHPLAIEHFPSGSLILPPAGLQKTHESLSAETTLSD